MDGLATSSTRRRGPMMAVAPTVELAKRNSKQRIDPLIEESEVLRERMKERRSRDSGNTVLSKEPPGRGADPDRRQHFSDFREPAPFSLANSSRSIHSGQTRKERQCGAMAAVAPPKETWLR
jgi:hypothetical protein